MSSPILANSDSTTATAVTYWNECWTHEKERKRWLMPAPEVQDIVSVLKERDVKHVLDLGCGVGRHALFLASQGFQVYALDGSANGIKFAREEAECQELNIDFQQGAMTELPYEAYSMEYVLAWNVIYHGDLSIVRHCLREVRRVLRPQGLYQGTMLSKRNAKFGKGREVAPNTYVNDDKGDKGHPHFYCNARELIKIFSEIGFELWSLFDVPDDKPDSYHWRVIAERR
jgi:SAM-dependent methyltransferase